MTKHCCKQKLNRLSAMLLVAKNKSPINKKHKRRETRVYWCSKCGAYHTTSKAKFLNEFHNLK